MTNSASGQEGRIPRPGTARMIWIAVFTAALVMLQAFIAPAVGAIAAPSQTSITMPSHDDGQEPACDLSTATDDDCSPIASVPLPLPVVVDEHASIPNGVHIEPARPLPLRWSVDRVDLIALGILRR